MLRGGRFTRFALEDGIRALPEYARLECVGAYSSGIPALRSPAR